MSIRDRVQAVLDRRSPAEKVLSAPPKKRWEGVKQSWELADKFAKSMASRALHGRVRRLDERVRTVSCLGLTVDGREIIPPCPAIADSQTFPGKHYCNECGCGDRDLALIDRDGYPKVAYPHLECPRRRDGFSNALPAHFAHEPSEADLLSVFQRVVVITLARRHDRIVRFYSEIPSDFPFVWPTPFAGIDGEKCPAPERHTQGNGAWGCLQSHRRALEDALNDGVRSLLVFEDDATFEPAFRERTIRFLRSVPSGWDCLMLGGQHIGMPGVRPVPVNPEVLRCANAQRMHAYAVRGPMIAALYRELCNRDGHSDHIMGPFAARWNTYAPVKWLVGQGPGKSDISGADNDLRLWNEPLETIMQE